jgi:C1A family cysteine protease
MAKKKIEISKRKIKKYGWKVGLPDHRDLLFQVPHIVPGSLPAVVDLRPHCPPVLDQGELGSCTANSIANAYYFDELKQKEASAFAPSRLFIYYNERVIEGDVKYDNGAQIRDGFKTIASQGVAPETLWPYNIAKFAKKPSTSVYSAALKHKAISYQSLTQDLNSLKGCLASGVPFVFGFTVYESFESDAVAKTGIVPMPAKTEKVLGGHAVLCVGYDDATQRFLVMNSWGTSWGQAGFFTIPYAYLTNTSLASDFWVVKTVS